MLAARAEFAVGVAPVSAIAWIYTATIRVSLSDTVAKMVIVALLLIGEPGARDALLAGLERSPMRSRDGHYAEVWR